jgi:hypothetical protein
MGATFLATMQPPTLICAPIDARLSRGRRSLLTDTLTDGFHLGRLPNYSDCRLARAGSYHRQHLSQSWW